MTLIPGKLLKVSRKKKSVNNRTPSVHWRCQLWQHIAHRLEINYIVIKCRVSLSRSPGGIDSLLSPILHIKSLTDGPQSVQCDHLYALINGAVRWVIIFYISRGIFPILIEKFIVRPRYLLFNFGAIEIWFVFVDGFLLFLAPRALHFFLLRFFFRRSPERRRKKLLYIGPGVACFEMRFLHFWWYLYSLYGFSAALTQWHTARGFARAARSHFWFVVT